MSDRIAVNGLDDRMVKLVERNRTILQAKSEGEICSWLLTNCSKQTFPPVYIFGEPSPQRQLQYLFEESNGELQEKLKSAVIQALREWSPAAHGLGVLRALALLAAYIRASMVDPFVKTLRRSGKRKTPTPLLS